MNEKNKGRREKRRERENKTVDCVRITMRAKKKLNVCIGIVT